MGKEYLSPHFSLQELTRSTICERNGIDNEPHDFSYTYSRKTYHVTKEDVESNLENLCSNGLEIIRAHFGNIPIKINSGFRCLELNTRIGSKKTSQHLRGCAADIEMRGLSNQYIFETIIANQIVSYDQIILEYFDYRKERVNLKGSYNSCGWNHFSMFRIPHKTNDPNRNRIMMIGSNPKVTDDPNNIVYNKFVEFVNANFDTLKKKNGKKQVLYVVGDIISEDEFATARNHNISRRNLDYVFCHAIANLKFSYSHKNFKIYSKYSRG